jgi:hypothetical protein
VRGKEGRRRETRASLDKLGGYWFEPSTAHFKRGFFLAARRLHEWDKAALDRTVARAYGS